MFQYLTISLVLIYFIICLWIGYVSYKNETSEGFFIADRKVGTFELTATIAASYIGANTVIPYTAYVFIYGISAFWMFIGVLIGFVIFTRFGLFLKDKADENKYYTLSDYFRDRHGARIALLTTSAVFIVYFGSLVNHYIAGAKVLEQASGFSYNISLISMTSVILIYLLLGGFKSEIKTDVFQFLLMLILPIILIFSMNFNIKVDPQHFNIFNAGIVNIVAFLFFGIFANFVYADLWQRVYAAQDKATIKKAFPLAGIAIIFMGILFTYFGLVARTYFSNIDADLAALYSFTQLIPASMLGLTLVFLFAAIMSTADTLLFVLAMNISQDFMNSNRSLAKSKEILYTRIAFIGFTLLGLLIAIFYPKMIDIIIVYSSIGVGLAPIVIVSWLSKHANVSAMKLSLLASFVAVLVLVLGYGIISPVLGLVSIATSTLVYLITFKIIKQRVKELVI